MPNLTRLCTFWILRLIALRAFGAYFGMTMTSKNNPETRAKLEALAVEIAKSANQPSLSQPSEQQVATQRKIASVVVDRVLIEDAELLLRLADS